jgi:hypothetical protein
VAAASCWQPCSQQSQAAAAGAAAARRQGVARTAHRTARPAPYVAGRGAAPVRALCPGTAQPRRASYAQRRQPGSRRRLPRRRRIGDGVLLSYPGPATSISSQILNLGRRDERFWLAAGCMHDQICMGLGTIAAQHHHLVQGPIKGSLILSVPAWSNAASKGTHSICWVQVSLLPAAACLYS